MFFALITPERNKCESEMVEKLYKFVTVTFQTNEQALHVFENDGVHYDVTMYLASI